MGNKKTINRLKPNYFDCIVLGQKIALTYKKNNIT